MPSYPKPSARPSIKWQIYSALAMMCKLTAVWMLKQRQASRRMPKTRQAQHLMP
ncbi:hypothetical protein [Moraxella lacunata]|uniref:hypothetical protein n=1 Tax=Moraxella lacunata TaxID=477 RepID=UPI003EE1B650